MLISRINRSIFLDYCLLRDYGFNIDNLVFILKKYLSLFFKSSHWQIYGNTFHTNSTYQDLFFFHELLISDYNIIKYISIHPKDNSIILDIGANIGQFYYFLRNIIGFKGKIMSYEPIEDVYKILQKNNIDSINVGISTKEEIIIAYNDSTLTATNLICESKHKIKAKGMQISKDNIDTDNIFMLKVDVEGNELDTLFAISDNILKITEYIFIECSGPGRSNNGDATEVISYLHKKGFSIVRFFSFSYDLSGEMIVGDILFRNKLSNN